MRILTVAMTVLWITFSPTANAFKVDTHTWLAEEIWQEIRDTNEVCLGLLPDKALISVPVPRDIRDAVLNFKNAFIAGTLGPDVYPDMVAGQMTTHPGLTLKYDGDSVHTSVLSILETVGGSFLDETKPGWQTDDWLKHVRDEALRVKRAKRGQPTAELAFAYGYMLHAAMDTWAHSYVNSYSGDIFSIGANQQSAARHVVLEGYINHLHESFYEKRIDKGSSKQQTRQQQLCGAARANRDKAGSQPLRSPARKPASQKRSERPQPAKREQVASSKKQPRSTETRKPQRPASSKRQSGTAQREKRAASTPVAAAINFVTPGTDRLTELRAPTEFVRRTLILNRSAATQYAREKGALHVWAMWFWWEYSKQVSDEIRQTRTTFDNRIDEWVQAIIDNNPLIVAAEIAERQAETAWIAADAEVTRVNGLLQDAEVASNIARSALLTAIQQNPILNSALALADGVIAQVYENIGFVGGEPLSLKNAYVAALGSVSKYQLDLKPLQLNLTAARAAWDVAIAGVSAAANNSGAAVGSQVRASLKFGLSQAWKPLDRLTVDWTRNIELGVDAYVRASEETIREIIRPKGSRFGPNPDPTWPMKEWAMCWGPVFGVGGSVAPQAARLCGQSANAFNEATTKLQTMVNDAFIPQFLKDQIDALNNRIKDEVLIAMPKVGQLVATIIDEPSVAASATLVARLWDSEVSLDDVIREYSFDESARNLPIFKPGRSANASEIRAALVRDGLPIGQSAPATYEQMLAFAPIHNAVMLSKLTLLDADALNGMVKALGETDTIYTNGPFGGAPLYMKSRRGGEVLIGAIRDIDGNHQWLPVSPDLPRNRYNVRDPRITEQKCRRFGYPAGKNYPIFERSFWTFEPPPSYVDCRRFEDYAIYQRASGIKGGFRLWQDKNLRATIFNKIFKGPLSQGICDRLIRQRKRDLAKQHGCNNPAERYPAVREDKKDLKPQQSRPRGKKPRGNRVNRRS
ncbi:MAG: hypothetical protein GXP15_08135 [Gammaproteobacteria bacterium]|nr:hypothetical protein [Gammaproteobacteria bacterium]